MHTLDGFRLRLSIPILATESIVRTARSRRRRVRVGAAAAAADDEPPLPSQPYADANPSATDEELRGEPVLVMLLARPLEGGIDAPAGNDAMDRGASRAVIALLRSCSESAAVFNELAAFARRVAAAAGCGPSGIGAMQPSIRIAMSGECARAAATLWGLSILEGAGPLARASITQAVESHANDIVYDAVYPWLLGMHEDATHDLSVTLATLKHLDQTALGVPLRFQAPQDAAVGALSSIESMRTPLEKMQCMTLAARCMVEAVEARLERDGVDTGE